jgi:outer membrane receptor protein involved in Fe transport
MKKNLLGLFVAALLLTVEVFAQGKVTGMVVDAISSEALPGANVMIAGTNNGATTDAQGRFSLNVPNKQGKVVVSYVGYESTSRSYSIVNGKSDLGKIKLSEDASTLGAIVLIGKGNIDLARDRKTPVAVATISPELIQAKAVNTDLPEIIKSTPSVQNVSGGGYGDGQVFLRGFDQTNTAFLLNGQPINGMEDGKMYWSNWTGVMDIANAIEVQRGLGSSKLAISSVGGTVNIVTKTIDNKKGGFISGSVANNNYAKQTAYYSTGLMKNGLAVSAMLGNWSGDGYIDGTKGQGQTYFLSLGYKANERSIFNFLITGAPQWHGTSRHLAIGKFLDVNPNDDNLSIEEQLQNERTYSNNYGYYKGRYYAGGRNFYHKPIANLNWDYEVSDDMNLSVTGYGSLGRGGFAYGDGIGRGANGLYDYDAAHEAKDGFVKASVNAHNWYGALANMQYQVTDELEVNFGADARFYNGQHYRTVVDFLGMDSLEQTNRATGTTKTFAVTEATGYNPWSAIPFFGKIDNNQRIQRNYQEDINYIGAFGQVEYATGNFSTFFQGAISNQSHQREGFWGLKSDTLDQGLGKSEKINNLGFNIKLGGSYNVSDEDKVFANFGYYSRQPYHDDLLLNGNYSNVFNPRTIEENQKITGVELGYHHRGDEIDVIANAYYTRWDNRVINDGGQDLDDDGVDDVFSIVGPLTQNHFGFELELKKNITDKLYAEAYLSLGDWRYGSDAVAETKPIEQDTTFVETDSLFLDGVRVGNVAQTTAGIGLTYKPVKGLDLRANYNYYTNMYGASTDVKSFKDKDNFGAIRLPSFATVDLGATYTLDLEKSQSLVFNVNVNNVFNTLYIENIRTNVQYNADEQNWKGVNLNNQVKWGYGRTWNFGVRYNF